MTDPLKSGCVAKGTTGRGAFAARRRGFTLIELLVVAAVIVILLGLLFPALGIARKSARTAETRVLMNTVSTGIVSFKADNQRSPGHFSQWAMGSVPNGGGGAFAFQGFTQMENAMLELAGGLVSESEYQDTGGDNEESQQSIQFALYLGNPPGQAAEAYEVAYVRPGQMGTTENSDYIALPASVLRPFEYAGEGTGYRFPLRNFAAEPADGGVQRTPMRYIMDPFDRPLMLWTANPTARYNPESGAANSDAFAQIESPTNPGSAGFDQALFYINSNIGLFRMSEIGARRDQYGPTMLDVTQNDEDRARTLEAMLGNPAFPSEDPVGGRIVPLSPIGTDIVMSSGADGIPFRRPVRGGALDYRFVRYGGAPGGNELAVDELDDLLQAAN